MPWLHRHEETHSQVRIHQTESLEINTIDKDNICTNWPEREKCGAEIRHRRWQNHFHKMSCSTTAWIKTNGLTATSRQKQSSDTRKARTMGTGHQATLSDGFRGYSCLVI